MLIKYNNHLLLVNNFYFFALYLTYDDSPLICKNVFSIYIKFNKYERLRIDYEQKLIYFCHGLIYDLNYNGKYDYFVNHVHKILLDCMSKK